MDVSIVIPVSTDLSLERCIASIDESVEVVISLNQPSAPMLELVDAITTKRTGGQQQLTFRVTSIDYPSIAGAYNNGIHRASGEYIILMDSDCSFAPGCIRKLQRRIGNGYLSKGRVAFTHRNRAERVIAGAREFHTSDSINAYSPPLMFRKDIVEHIGGYYFHPALCWLEDSEFDARVRRAGLEIKYDGQAVVYHDPLSPRRDLHSAFMYGVGKAIGVELGIDKLPSGPLSSARKYLSCGAQAKGPLVGLYLYVWKLTLLVGFQVQRRFRIRPVEVPTEQ